MLLHGLYPDAETTGPADAHDRLAALALLPVTVDAGDWRIVPRLAPPSTAPTRAGPSRHGTMPAPPASTSPAPGRSSSRPSSS